MGEDVTLIDQLLDGVGRLTGLEFQLMGDDQAPAPPPDVLLHAGAAWCAPDGEGRHLYGVPVTRDETRRLLLATPRTNGHLATDPRDNMMALMNALGGLMEAEGQATGETRQMTNELNRAYEDLYLFARIATQIRSLQFSSDMFPSLLAETREAMRVDLAAALFAEAPLPFVAVAAPDADLPAAESERQSFLERLLEVMTAEAPSFEGNSLIVDDSSNKPCFATLHARPFRALAIEIRHADVHYGWLVLLSFNMTEIFRRGEYRLLSTMAGQVALVIANTALYNDLEHFVINLVRSLVMAIEAKDDYTRGHSERVSRLSMAIAAEIGLDARELHNLQWASILHDLGKIGTPESILNKQGRLTEAEFEEIKAHPAKGADILRPINQLEPVLTIIRNHHEHYDGSGYPDGLKGEAIPLASRIIAVADTYDAITSARAYRAARSHEEAMHIIRDCAGTQLDPGVVTAFVRIVQAGLHFQAGEEPRIDREEAAA